jgi:hypothetical protein
LIIEDETPVACRVTGAIGDFQKSLPFVSAALLHTAITFGQKLPIFPRRGSPVRTDRGKIPPIFDESEIRIRLGCGSGHDAMIPLHQIIFSLQLFALSFLIGFDTKQLAIAD